jgi:hypothetical protein
VERKRVAEVMKRMRAAQDDPARRHVLAKRLGRSEKAKGAVVEARCLWRTSIRTSPEACVVGRAPPSGRAFAD